MKAEASAHLAAVVRLDPTREAAWKRLGCKKHHGRWMTESQIAAEKDEKEAQKKGDERWKPLLSRWRGWLGNKNKRDEAELVLATVTDPYAVPAIWAVFVEGGEGERNQAKAVQLLGQIDSAAGLPQLSDAGRLQRLCGGAADRNRDPQGARHPRVSRLNHWVVAQRVKYEVRPVGGPGSPGVLFVEGQRFNVQRLYAPPPMPNIPVFPGELVTYDAAGLPVIQRFLGSTLETKQNTQTERWDMGLRRRTWWQPPAARDWIRLAGPDARAVGGEPRRPQRRPSLTSIEIPIGQLMLQYQTAAQVARQQQLDDIRVVEDYNGVVGRLNDRATQVLRGVTGEDLGEDPQSWTGWWVDQLGYAYSALSSQPVPTFVENVPLTYLPQGVNTPVSNQAGPSTTTTSVASGVTPGGFTIRHNCFKAGTPVRTLAGPRAIELIRVGDQVLTQDVQTRSLDLSARLGRIPQPPERHAQD